MEEDLRSVEVHSMEDEIKLPRHMRDTRVLQKGFYFLFFIFLDKYGSLSGSIGNTSLQTLLISSLFFS